MFKHFTIILFISIVTGCSDDAQLKPLAQDATVLAFGDSLTYGTGTTRDKAYPAVLEKLIQRRVINAGIPGEISEKGLQRLPGLISQHQPALIILCHGANDILRKLNIENAEKNIQKMITLAKEHDIQVVVIGVPKFGLFLNTSPIYHRLADSNGLPIENNALSDILGTNKLKSDYIHPNGDGYRLLAEKIYALLKLTGATP